MEMMTRFEWIQAQAFDQRQPRRQFSPEVEAEVARLFPNVDPGVRPFGQRVLVQLRLSKQRSPGGIELVAETRDTQQWNEAVAQVLALGPLAFKKRDTLEPWGEGEWAEVGDFVRVPRFGGDRWEVLTPDLEAQERLEARKGTLEARIALFDRGDDIVHKFTSREQDELYRLQQELKQVNAQPEQTMPVIFAQFNDHELIGQVTGNPVDMRVYV